MLIVAIVTCRDAFGSRISARQRLKKDTSISHLSFPRFYPTSKHNIADCQFAHAAHMAGRCQRHAAIYSKGWQHWSYSSSLRRYLGTDSSPDGALKNVEDLPSIAPKPQIDIKRIRDDPEIYRATCIDRNYHAVSGHAEQIVKLSDQLKQETSILNGLRRRVNLLTEQLQGNLTEETKQDYLQQAKLAKEYIVPRVRAESELQRQIQYLALQLPNTTSEHTPIGDTPSTLR